MIDMGMRQKNVIHIRSRNRNFLILIKILALLHTTVNENLLACRFEIMLAACYLMCRSRKKQLHKKAPLLW